MVLPAYSSLRELQEAVVGCDRCPRLRQYCAGVAEERKPAYRNQKYWGRPVPGHGDPDARLLVVGLAPGAHGANRTGRLFTGDESSQWLATALFLHRFANQPNSDHAGDGLRLRNAYISNAVRCAPPENKPQAAEVAACRPYLEAEIELLTRLQVVLTLGRLAFETTAGVLGGAGLVFRHGAVYLLPGRPTLVASYHPSQQNTRTGLLTPSMWMEIFALVRRELDPGQTSAVRLAPGTDSGIMET